MKVWLTEDERVEIEHRVKLSGLSQSAYLRVAGLNHPIRSVLDFDAVLKLVAVSGDLGRLGGLLKRWLDERSGQGARAADIQRLLHDTRALQDAMRECMGTVLSKRRR